ncbi:MAG TPA: hypothetical protein VFC46_03525 [Humisphaera sp.]|nr:hypothetical protein [Humisphaera sp.]
MRFAIAAFMLMGFGVAFSAHAAECRTSFKGWELYILPDGKEWKFSLMEGANRLKSEDEINAAAVKGLDAIKKKLDELKSGEDVFVTGRSHSKAPPKDIAKALVEYGKARGLKMQ